MTCGIVRILHCNIAMKIHEYQAKALLARYGVPVPRGEVVMSVKEAEAAAARIGGISYFHEYAYDLLAENERITAASFDTALWAHRERN